MLTHFRVHVESGVPSLSNSWMVFPDEPDAHAPYFTIHQFAAIAYQLLIHAYNVTLIYVALLTYLNAIGRQDLTSFITTV